MAIGHSCSQKSKFLNVNLIPYSYYVTDRVQ